MNIENNEASANIGDPLATVSRRFSVAPMMDWTNLSDSTCVHGRRHSFKADL